MSPQARRQCVNHLVAKKTYSERKACQLIGISRSSHRYQAKAATDDKELRAKMHQVANDHKAYGYRLVTGKIRGEGWLVNHKRIHRLWQEEGLQQTRRRKRKRYYGPKGEVKQKATHKNHVWSYDFVEDRTEKGRKLRILAVMDEYTRECLAIHVARSIPAADVLQLLAWLFLVYGRPEHIRSDNGPEFVAQAVQTWLAERNCQTIYITPGSPWENPFIESFMATLRRECLDQYQFRNGREARHIIEEWRQEYNQYRPHSSLGYLPPSEFAQQQPATAGSLMAAAALPHGET